MDLSEQFDQEIQSWDLAFKDLETSDYAAGGVWGVEGADRYFLDQVRDRLGFPETVEKMTLKWPKASLKLVEDKANGPVPDLQRGSFPNQPQQRPHHHARDRRRGTAQATGKFRFRVRTICEGTSADIFIQAAIRPQ